MIFPLILIIISFFWLAVFAKKLFFWVYLWQLKEYHVGRFLDHFHTYKGKKLLFNKLLALKILVLLGIYVSAALSLRSLKMFFVYFIPFIFLIEAAFFLRSVKKKTFKRPVFTQKASVISSSGFSLGILILFGLFLLEFSVTKFVFSLLFFDVLAIIFFSWLVLLFQPLAVFLRNRIIRAARKKRLLHKNLLVVGITGSYGKTSTKELLAAILSKKFRILKTKEHQNSEVGISQCILQELKPEHEVFIVEMGAYNRGGIKLLCNITKPKIGVITGINEQHMATFGSQKNIVNGKYELIESLPEDGVAFFNAKNKYCLEMYNRTKVKKILYGTIACELGRENVLGAMAVAKELGMTGEEISEGIKNIRDWLPGVQIKKGINGLEIIDATYSANPDGVMANLEYLKNFPAKKIIVMPCLIELGHASKEVHKRIGRKIGEVCDLAIITTKDRMKEIKEGAPKALFMENPQQIVKRIKSYCRPGDAVLLESRVPKKVIEELLCK